MDQSGVFHQLPGTHRRILAANEVLFVRGDAPWGMFLLETGSVRLRRFGRNGEEMTIATVTKGQTFAEASLFSEAYHCDCVAGPASQVLVIPQRAVFAQIERDAGFAKFLIHRLAGQLQESRMRVEIRGMRSAEERVMAALNLRAGPEFLAVLPGTLKQFASEIGLTHESLYRVLKRLEQTGRILREGKDVRIL